MGAAVLTFFTQVVESLVVLTTDRVSHIPEDVRVFAEPVRVFQMFESFGWLNSMLGAHLLIIVLRISLLTIAFRDIYAKLGEVGDQVHVVSHDENVVSLVDLTFYL